MEDSYSKKPTNYRDGHVANWNNPSLENEPCILYKLLPVTMIAFEEKKNKRFPRWSTFP